MDKSRRTLQNVLSIMMVALLLIGALSPMFSLAAPSSGPEAADESTEPLEPTADSWTITDTRYINESQGIDSDIIVDGGELYVNNATMSLLIDGYDAWQVTVKNGGLLKMWNSTLKTDPQESLRPFAKTKVTAEGSSTILMKHNSSFEFPGWVHIQNSELTMKDSRFEALSNVPEYDYIWDGSSNDGDLDDDDNDDGPLLFVNESSEVLLQRSNITDYYENEHFKGSGEMNWTTTDTITNVSGGETLDLQNWTLNNPMLDHDDIEDYPYLNPTPRLSALYLEFSYSTEENYTDGNGTLEYWSPSEGWKELKKLPAGNDTVVKNIYESGLGEFYREGGEYMHDLHLRVENTGSSGTNETNISINEGSLRLVSAYENDIYVENSDLNIIDSELDIDFNAADIDPRDGEDKKTNDTIWMPDAATTSSTDHSNSHSVIRSIDSSVRAYGVEATDAPSATGDPVIVTNDENDNNTWIYRWARLDLKNEQNKTLPGAKVEVIPDNGDPLVNDKVANLNDPENSSNAFAWDYLKETGMGEYNATDDTYITGEDGSVTMLLVSDRINQPEDWPNSKFMGNYELNITYEDQDQNLYNNTRMQFRLKNFPNITRSANHPVLKPIMDVPLPDLSVGTGDLVFRAHGEETQEVSSGTDVEVNLTVHNEGDWEANDVKVRFYKDDVHTANILNTNSIDIDAGYNETTNFTWTPTEIGNFTIIAVVDGNEVIPELNETNNQVSRQITVNEKADLYIDEIYVSPDTEVFNGTDVSISARVGNSGDTDVQEANVSFYYNKSSMTERERFASELFPVPANDEFNTSEFLWNYPGIGNYTISVEIWPTDSTVVESTEVNNNMSESVNVTSLPDLELRADSLQVLSDNGTQINDLVLGEQVTLNLTVYNIGDIKANDINISVYLDSTNGKIIGNKTIPELGPGENRSFNLSWTPEETGDHTLVAKADAPENITELEERNNIDTYSVSIQEHPDLTVDDIFFDPNPPIMNGTELNISAVIQNEGGIDVSDVNVTFRYNSSSLAQSRLIGNTSLNVSAGDFNLTTPLNWDYPGRGEYEIIAIVDPEDEINETDENNNTLSELINIDSKPDLIPTDYTLSLTEVRDGETLTISSKVTNQGGTDAQDVWATFYLDKYTPSEETLGTAYVGDVNSGQTSDTITVTWDAGIDGDVVNQDRTITITVNDPGYEEDEIEKDNNEENRTVTVYEPAALSIEDDDISFSDTRLTQVGTSLQIYAEVENSGGRGVTTDVTFFDGATIPNNMINQTTINVDKLDTSNASVSWTPTTIANHSNHDINVVVDYQEEVYEEDETDNEASVIKPIFSENYRFDLIVDGTDTREMTGKTVHGGFVVVEDSGTLEISGSNPRAEFSMNMDSDNEFSIIVRDNGQLTLDHSLIDSSHDVNIYVENDAGLKLMDQSRSYSMVGVVGTDNSKVDISDSIVEGNLDIRSGDFVAKESQFISPDMFLQPDTIECINVTFEDDLVDFKDTVGSLTKVDTGQIELKGDSEIEIYRWVEATALSQGGTPVADATIDAINRNNPSYSMTKTTDGAGMTRFRLITDVLLPSGSRALSNYRFNGTYQEEALTYYSDDITTSLPLYPSDTHVIQKDINFPNLEIPDLRVDSVSVTPSEVTEGEHVEMTVQITNIGGADASGIGVHFFVVAGGDEVELNTSTISLDEGSTTTVTSVWTDPDVTVAQNQQMRQIIVRVDSDVDPVSDVNPGNNEGSSQVSVKTPVDIEFDPSLTIFGHNQETPPDNLTERDEITLEVGIINTGGTMAKNLTITYLLDGEPFGENDGQIKMDELEKQIYVHNGTLRTNGDGLNLTIKVETGADNETVLRNQLTQMIDVKAMNLELQDVTFSTETQEQGDSVPISGNVIRTKDDEPVSGIDVYVTLSKDGEEISELSETGDNGDFLITITTPNEGGEYTVEIRPDYEDERAVEQEGKISVKGGGEAGIPLWMLIAVIVAIAGSSIGGVFAYLRYTGPAEWVECGNCGATIPADSNECPECAVEFETDTVKCSECGEWIPSDADECPHCGSSFITTGTEVEDYEDRMKKQYQEFVDEYREKAKEELGDDFTENEFMDWWEDQPSYITFDEWVEREEARRKEGGIECPECGALNSMDAGVCQKCGNPLIHLEEEKKEKEEIEEEELDLKTIGEGEEETKEGEEETEEAEEKEEAGEPKKVKKKVKKEPKKVKKKVKKEPKKVKKKVKKEPKKVKKKPKEEEEEEEE